MRKLLYLHVLHLLMGIHFPYKYTYLYMWYEKQWTTLKQNHEYVFILHEDAIKTEDRSSSRE